MYSVARAACPSCKVSTPLTLVGEKAKYDPLQSEYAPFVQGGVNNDCYNNFAASLHNYSNVRDAFWGLFFKGTCGEQGRPATGLSALIQMNCNLMSGAANITWNSFADEDQIETSHETCTRSQRLLGLTYNFQRFIGDVMRNAMATPLGKMATEGIEPPPIYPRQPPSSIGQGGHEYTLGDALEDGLLVNVTAVANYSRYIDACLPTMCTFHTSSIGDRLAETVALTLGVLGAVLKVFRILLNFVVSQLGEGDPSANVDVEQKPAVTPTDAGVDASETKIDDDCGIELSNHTQSIASMPNPMLRKHNSAEQIAPDLKSTYHSREQIARLEKQLEVERDRAQQREGRMEAERSELEKQIAMERARADDIIARVLKLEGD